ncbi:MAG: PEP-CTERM sorting domain-containing protein [Pyrinomonadaceae bacterium]
MRNFKLRFLLSAMCVASILAGFTTTINAAPIRFDQVVQVLNARPEKSGTGSFTQLRVAGDYSFIVGDDDEEKKKSPQDGRVITETKSDIVNDDVCDCTEPDHDRRRFPKWALLGLAAIPIAFILIKDDDDKTPTPTPSTPQNSPTKTPTPMTPQPTKTPHNTPPPSPTPPEPVPEPVTILLFGTGLASIGLAARRKYGKKDNGDGGKEGN